MSTGFEKTSDTELAREWEQIMSSSTLEGIKSSVRFLRICQELDKRKLTPWRIGLTLSATNESEAQDD